MTLTSEITQIKEASMSSLAGFGVIGGGGMSADFRCAAWQFDNGDCCPADCNICWFCAA